MNCPRAGLENLGHYNVPKNMLPANGLSLLMQTSHSFPQPSHEAIGYAQEHKLDMLTGLGELEVQSFWERVMQPQWSRYPLRKFSFRSQ